MDVSTVLTTVLLLLVPPLLLLLIPWAIRRAKFVHQLEKIPGPRAYPLVGSVLDFVGIPRNQLFSFMETRVKQYPPIFRTWLGPVAEVQITRAEHVEVIFNSSKLIDKSFGYKFMEPWLGKGLLTSTGSKWHSHRKMITPTFHFKILDNFVEVFVEKSNIMIGKLLKEAGGDGFDVYPYITRCALDIICETAMGTPINAQEDVHSDYVKAVYELSELIIQRSIRPWLHTDFVFYRSARGRRQRECLNILHGFTKKIIGERRDLLLNGGRKEEEDEGLFGKKRKAFLDLLLEATLNGVGLTDEEIREEVDTFMFEGHDTTTAGICWTLYLLGQHPEVQEKVHAELDEMYGGSERAATMHDLQDMNYLERVIKESLRLYPSVPMIGRMLSHDVTVGGYNIPSGCTVNLHIYHVHRDPKQFPDPERFDPDNFLPERVQKRHPYAYVPFSAGPRNCIGQKFALLEEKTILSSVLRHFSVRSLDKPEDINLMVELILRPENGIRVILTPRESVIR